MRIIIICGSLETGRDGVGDYVRRLAIELIKNKHILNVIAINDTHISYSMSEIEHINGIDLPIYRLPSTCSWSNRLINIETLVDNFDPEWISLQYVPFSFHKKGLPVTLNSKLAKIGRGRRWHIMFHELWIGMEIGAPTKQLTLGWIQRKIIYFLIKRLKPHVIHTQSQLYLIQLSKLGFKSKYLPLFTNINYTKYSKINTSNNKSKNFISLVLFGSIHPNAPVEQLAKEAALYAKLNQVKIILIFIGRCGVEQEHWATAWMSVGLEVQMLGEQKPEYISKVLEKATLGVTTTPLALVDKSGTVAAMRAHGLPIICVSRPWYPRGVYNLKLPTDVHEYKSGNFEFCISNRSTVFDDGLVKNICLIFMNDLLNSQENG
ncbi:glycosyltransferase [Rufibacter sp. XAAS-G3-1]|uniref:glycosyltransferase n=1 Tax=Rufibacter sp. XAAS-G3-1 TaxID=2729134 RepID=UPI0015E74239|nr:glycosyltransferase [Rufibacter sp. XAAS-G3-1]